MAKDVSYRTCPLISGSCSLKLVLSAFCTPGTSVAAVNGSEAKIKTTSEEGGTNFFFLSLTPCDLVVCGCHGNMLNTMCVSFQSSLSYMRLPR